MRREDGTRVPLGPHGLRIGRSDESDLLVLSDPKVSRNHASILLVETGFAIADHHSTNGTFVDGAPRQGSQQLGDGNVVTIGTPFSSLTRSVSARVPGSRLSRLGTSGRRVRPGLPPLEQGLAPSFPLTWPLAHANTANLSFVQTISGVPSL